ncbi:hypothetical protein Hanom_Chr10g00945351 [Helianthus anomalus]
MSLSAVTPPPPHLELLLPFSQSDTIPTLSPTHSVSVSLVRLQVIGAGHRRHFLPSPTPWWLRRGYLWRRKKLKREREKSREERTRMRERTGEEEGGRRQTVGGKWNPRLVK